MLSTTRKTDGIPRSTIHMGAGSFTLTSSVNGQVSRVDLNDKKVSTRRIGEFLCKLHGIGYQPPRKRRSQPVRPATTTKFPVGWQKADLSVAM